jgi:hypothetical protein
MKTFALIPLSFALVLVLAACELDDKDKEGLKKDCSAPPAALKSTPRLPGNFPRAQGIVYTAVKKDGPTTIASGYLAQTIGPAHDAYSQAVKGAPGYNVTKEEQDAADAEVNFAGAGNTGQVKLLQTCKARTSVTITIRPA